MTSLEEAMGRLDFLVGVLERHHQATIDLSIMSHDCAVHADDVRTLLTALRSRPTVEEVARVIETHTRAEYNHEAAGMNEADVYGIDDAAHAVLSLFEEEGK